MKSLNPKHASLAIVVAAIPALGLGHHSTVEYDFDVVEELEGEVVDVFWRNPHVRLTLRTEGEDGGQVLWDLEGQSANALGRRGLQRDPIRAGDFIRVAGNLSRRRNLHMYVTNILLETGTEIRTRGNTQPRFVVDRAVGFDQPDVEAIRKAAGAADRVFGVWMREAPGGFADELPLTSSARSARAAWDSADDFTANCVVGGMPGVMMRIGSPHPIELVENRDHIVLRIELFDVIRTIHMQSDERAAERPADPLGYSEGRWDGDSLVVRTTRVSSHYFDAIGSLPLSDEAEIIERFSPDSTGHRLDYDITVTDSANFTEPVSARWILGWRPDLEIQPYQCTLGG